MKSRQRSTVPRDDEATLRKMLSAARMLPRRKKMISLIEQMRMQATPSAE